MLPPDAQGQGSGAQGSIRQPRKAVPAPRLHGIRERDEHIYVSLDARARQLRQRDPGRTV